VLLLTVVLAVLVATNRLVVPAPHARLHLLLSLLLPAAPCVRCSPCCCPCYRCLLLLLLLEVMLPSSYQAPYRRCPAHAR
jgi:hypothetical protein